MKPQPGLALGGRYRLIRQIAVGGMGEVWVAKDESLARDIAIKVLKEEFVGNSDFLNRFRVEARNAASLSHAHIAQLYDYGEQDGSAYLVMELVNGEPMSDLLEREPVLPMGKLLTILAQTARALHAAHVGGVVHRDIKPGNIIIEHTGDVKITDFGVSLAANQVPMTAAGMVMGTAQYLSPEQAVGRAATGASDIYALGIVAYEGVAGNRPFTGKTPVDIAVAHVNEPVPPLPKNTDPEFSALVMRMLAKNPLERPRSAAALAHTFESLSQKIAQDPWPGIPHGGAAGARAAGSTRNASGAGRSAGSPGSNGSRPYGSSGSAGSGGLGGSGNGGSGVGGNSGSMRSSVAPGRGPGAGNLPGPGNALAAGKSVSIEDNGPRIGRRGAPSSGASGQVSGQGPAVPAPPATYGSRSNAASVQALPPRSSSSRTTPHGSPRTASQRSGSGYTGRTGAGFEPPAPPSMASSHHRDSADRTAPASLVERVKSLGAFTLALIGIIAAILLATLVKGIVSSEAAPATLASACPIYSPVEFTEAHLAVGHVGECRGGSLYLDSATQLVKDAKW